MDEREMKMVQRALRGGVQPKHNPQGAAGPTVLVQIYEGLPNVPRALDRSEMHTRHSVGRMQFQHEDMCGNRHTIQHFMGDRA